MKLVALMLTLLWSAHGAAEELDLSLRGLEAAPEDLCSRGVRVANLCANKLQAAPHCCSSFRRLYLYRNSIGQLPDHWLDDCPLLEELSVSGNLLSRLPAGLLGSSTALRRLQASRNQLVTLPPQLLANTTALTELDLSHNLLVELPQGVLDTTSNLVELFLQANSLSDLPEHLLASCGRLRVLWLSGNRLTNLPKLLLSGSPRLRSLRLDHNLIADVAAGALDNSAKLRFLDLSSNRLTSLPAGLFGKLASLRRLLLADNLLAAVPPAGSLPPQPLFVDLSHNLLQAVEDFGAFGESRVLLDHNAWCRDLVPASQLAHFHSRRWFQQRAVRYDRLAGPLSVEGLLLQCGGSTAARGARAAVKATARRNNATVTGSPPAFVGTVTLTDDEGPVTLESKYSTPARNTPRSEDVKVIGLVGSNEIAGAIASSDIAGTEETKPSASAHPLPEVPNTTIMY